MSKGKSQVKHYRLPKVGETWYMKGSDIPVAFVGTRIISSREYVLKDRRFVLLFDKTGLFCLAWRDVNGIHYIMPKEQYRVPAEAAFFEALAKHN